MALEICKLNYGDGQQNYEDFRNSLTHKTQHYSNATYPQTYWKGEVATESLGIFGSQPRKYIGNIDSFGAGQMCNGGYLAEYYGIDPSGFNQSVNVTGNNNNINIDANGARYITDESGNIVYVDKNDNMKSLDPTKSTPLSGERKEVIEKALRAIVGILNDDSAYVFTRKSTEINKIIEAANLTPKELSVLESLYSEKTGGDEMALRTKINKNCEDFGWFGMANNKDDVIAKFNQF